jgi:hypothetical protein
VTVTVTVTVRNKYPVTVTVNVSIYVTVTEFNRMHTYTQHASCSTCTFENVRFFVRSWYIKDHNAAKVNISHPSRESSFMGLVSLPACRRTCQYTKM